MTSTTTKKPTGPSWLRWSAQPLGRKITPEQLHNLVYQVLAGDGISLLPPGHDGSPVRRDENGDTKAGMRDLLGTVPNFDAISGLLSSPKGRLALFISTRTFIEKRGKVRPIDIPSEAKRYDQLGMLVLTLVPLVVEKDALDPRVVGFRTLDEFRKFTDRKDGITIQDVFGHSMLLLIREHGPFILLIDLQDAYPNLPHSAIHVALKELLGMNHQERRRIVESARVRTRLPNGKLLKPTRYGIEQGSPIAPLLFNLVQSLIARRLREHGFESGCFGDDIGIAATTRAEAERAFEVYKKILGGLGFNLDKLRPLGDPEVTKKASFIYDARSEAFPLINTYLVTIDEIGLNADKLAVLISRLTKSPSFGQVQRANRWKMVSNSFLRRVWKTLQSPSVKETGLEEATPSQPQILIRSPGDVALAVTEPDGVLEVTPLLKDQDTEMPSCLDTGMGGGESTLCLQGVDATYGQKPSSLYLYSLDGVTLTSSFVEMSQPDSGKTASTGQAAAGTPCGGRMSVLRDGSEPGLTLAGNGVEMDGHPVSTSKPVFVPLTAEDADALAEGRRLRVGDNYRPARPASPKKEAKGRVVLDIRGVGDRVPESRRAGAVGQLLRVASNSGRADLLVHPGDTWVRHLVARDGNGFRVHVREHPEGVVVTARKVLVGTKPPAGTTEAPPVADVVIDRITRSAADRLQWAVRAHTAAGVEHRTFRVRCYDATIGRIEALAQAMGTWPSTTVAFPAFGQVHRLLGGKVRVRQVDLHRAVESVKGRTFKKVSPGWMLATR